MNARTRKRSTIVATAVLMAATGFDATATTSAVAATGVMERQSTAAEGVRATVHPPLVRRLLTPKELSGFRVARAPQVQASYTTPLGCILTAPKASMTADTSLVASAKLSSTETRTVTIGESATGFPDIASARAFLAKIRTSVSSCEETIGNEPADGITVSSRFVPTAVAPGASHAFATVTTASGTYINGNHRYVEHTSRRDSVYQTGRYIVVIDADRVTTTTTATRETELSVDDAALRRLTTRAATAAIRLLTSP